MLLNQGAHFRVEEFSINRYMYTLTIQNSVEF